MSATRWRGLATSACCALVIVGVSGCDERNQFVPPPPPEVTVAMPVARDVVPTIEFTGTTRATAKVDLRARVNGYLERIEFEDGQMVSEGDLLFVIEQAPFRAELHGAEANIQKALATLQLAEANMARATALRQRNVTSQQELDVQQAQSATASAEVAAAQAALEQAKLNLNYTEIRAPISGRIGRHLVDQGNLVQAETSLLATIESIDPIHAYFYVSERELLRFKQMHRENQLPDPETHPPVLHLGVADEAGFPHQGILDYGELGIDSTTGTVVYRGVFANPHNTLIPGLFVRIREQLGEPVSRLLIDERALGSDQRGDFVLVVDGQNQVEYRQVELGIAMDGMRVIEKGVNLDDRIVVNGLQRARPGAEVNPQLAQPAASQEQSHSATATGNDRRETRPSADWTAGAE